MYREIDSLDWDLVIVLDPSAGRVPPTFEGEPGLFVEHWWRVAVVAVDGDRSSRRAGSTSDRAATLLRERLSQRADLLDGSTWQRLVSDVVQACMQWGFNAKKVVRLSEKVADRVLFTEQSEGDWGRWSAGNWREHRGYFLRDLGFLRRYIKPPAAAGSTPEEKKTPGKQSQGRSRKGVGGPKKKYPPKLRAAIITDRKREEKKRNPEPLKTWLTTWATAHDMKRAEAKKMYDAEMAAIRRAVKAARSR
jgi:hypothetical protein